MFGLQPYDRDKGSDLFRYFDDFERRFFGAFPRMNAVSCFRTDIRDEGTHFVLEAELPGFEKQEIQVDLKGDMLTIRAEHHAQQEETKSDFVHRERRCGMYARSFNLDGIETDAITGSYQNGVLMLHLPKKAEKKSETKRIELQ